MRLLAGRKVENSGRRVARFIFVYFTPWYCFSVRLKVFLAQYKILHTETNNLMVDTSKNVFATKRFPQKSRLALYCLYLGKRAGHNLPFLFFFLF